MKKLFLLVFVIITNYSIAQNSCSNPYVYNSIPGFTAAMPTTGYAQVGPNYNCLGSQPNPLWIVVPFCSAGDMNISINDTALNGDLDFNVWGPFNGMNMPAICNNLSGSGVDCSYGTGTTDTINLPVSNSGDYYLILITNFTGQPNNVILNTVSGSAVSDTSCFVSTQNCNPIPMPICEVTMNDSANHCKILWEKPASIAVEKYYIYRLNSMSVYDLIDSIPDSDSSYYIDYDSWPATQPYRYKIYYRDTCGNLSISSGLHQSIHLQASPGFNSVNLDWDEYIGLFFTTYYILRGSDPFNMNLIDSIASAFTSYTDFNAIPGEPFYQVGFTNPDPCVVSRSSEELVVSNVYNTGPTGIEEFLQNDFSVYPNPASDVLIIKNRKNKIINSITINDLTGRKIKNREEINNSKIETDISDLASGTYLLSVVSEGKTVVQKLIVR